MEEKLNKKNNSGKNLSRRSFLKTLPLGLFAFATIGVIGTNLMKSVKRRRVTDFKKDSIFTPKSPQ
jgi:hypothetical protein